MTVRIPLWLIVVLAAAVGVLGTLLVTRSGKDNRATKGGNSASDIAVQRIPLEPLDNPAASGVARIVPRGDHKDLLVEARLAPTRHGQAYEAWLYNSRSDAVPVGAQVTDAEGNWEGRGLLPADASRFKAIDVSLQTIPSPNCQRVPNCLRSAAAHSGHSVLRGVINK